MKILLLTDRMDAGGAETHIAELARGLFEMGNEVAVLSAGGRMADLLESEGILQYRTPPFTRSPFRWLRLRAFLKRLVKVEKFEILHAHARIPALLLRGCRRWGSAAVVSVHAAFRTDRWLSRICYWGERTVAVSEDLRQYVCQNYRVPAERVRVIPNGIDCLRFSAAGDAVRGRSVLFVSRLDRDCAEGAALLCEIAPRLCEKYFDLSITIVGGGAAYAEILEKARLANRVIGREAVRLTGWATDLPRLMRESAIFVGVSRAAMEAAACGAAVILCGNEGYLGILDHDNLQEAAWSNFCARGCEKPTADRLLQDLGVLLDFPDRLAASAALGYHFVTEERDRVRMCEETLLLYRRLRPGETHRRVAVGGYFGCGNLGDDAMLLGLGECLAESAPGVAVTALSGSPSSSRRRFGLSCVGRKNPIAVLWALLRCDAFLLGGGSLLQNATSQRSLWYYLGLLRLAQILGRPTFVFASGIGPLAGGRAIRSTMRVLSQCRYISLRDEASYDRLREWGIEDSLLHHGADPALLLPRPPRGRAESILRECPAALQQAGFFCVAVREGGAELREILREAIAQFCRMSGMSALFLIFDKSDTVATEALCREVGGELISPSEAADAMAILSAARFVLSMRLHALVLASGVGTPAVGLPSHGGEEKLSAFARESEQTCLSREALSASALLSCMEALFAVRSKQRQELLALSEKMRKKGAKDLANIVEMIYNKR